MHRIPTGGRARVLGVIDGVEPLSGVDFLLKLAEADATGAGTDILFEQPHPDERSGEAWARPMFLLDRIQDFRERGASLVVLPCFTSYSFMKELKTESPLPIADMMEALVIHVRVHFPEVRRLGILTSLKLRAERLFEHYFEPAGIEVLHAADPLVPDTPQPLESLRASCTALKRQGAQLLLPASMELTLALQQMQPGMPVIDAHRIYARHVVQMHVPPPLRPFKLGVVGGVGPAATVDFLDKLVRNTAAQRDQDHIKVMVEHNPQIPDRTAHLLGRGADPTLALYATCRRLQAGEVDLIAIPCNTAHAFVTRLQPRLTVPILDMVTVTVEHIRARFPNVRVAGLLATSGTIASGIYQQALKARDLEQLVPQGELQAGVMNALYGPQGIKAGHRTGPWQDDLSVAIEDLAARGAHVIILGCTELPLVMSGGEARTRSGLPVMLVDPTEILALRCVARAEEAAASSESGGEK